MQKVLLYYRWFRCEVLHCLWNLYSWNFLWAITWKLYITYYYSDSRNCYDITVKTFTPPLKNSPLGSTCRVQITKIYANGSVYSAVVFSMPKSNLHSSRLLLVGYVEESRIHKMDVIKCRHSQHLKRVTIVPVPREDFEPPPRDHWIMSIQKELTSFDSG